MRSIRLTNVHSSHSGQVSLEALILWSGFAAVLALLLPAFTEMVHAQSVYVEVGNVRSFSNTLANNITRISFLAPGSVLSIHIPVEKNLTLSVEENSFFISYFDSEMKSPHEEEISSILPLTYEPQSQNPHELTLIRTQEGITFQFPETFLP